MEATLERIEKEAISLPAEARAELVAALLKSLGEGAPSRFTSFIDAAVTPILKPILEAGPAVYGRLFELKTSGLISEETCLKAGMAWASIILDAGTGLPPAEVTPGENGSVLIKWEREERHLRIQVRPAESPTELFYESGAGGETWSHSWAPGAPLPPSAQARIRFLGASSGKNSGEALSMAVPGKSLFGAARPFITRTPPADEDWDEAVARSIASEYPHSDERE